MYCSRCNREYSIGFFFIIQEVKISKNEQKVDIFSHISEREIKFFYCPPPPPWCFLVGGHKIGLILDTRVFLGGKGWRRKNNQKNQKNRKNFRKNKHKKQRKNNQKNQKNRENFTKNKHRSSFKSFQLK